MNWPAALSIAVLRVTRTAVGRRALQVAVLVSGLFVFGFLCGERAHAAEGAPLPLGQVQRQIQDPVQDPVQVQVLRVTDSLAEPVKPVVPSAVEDTVGKVVQPVGGLVETVTEELAEVTAQVPTLPALPEVPELPVLPALPELPGVPASPTVPSSPASPAPPPVSPASPASPASPSSPDKTPPTTAPRTHQGGGVAYGPRFVGRVGGAGETVAGDRGGVRVSRAAVRQAPGGLPGGVSHGALGERAVVEAGSSRHGGGHGDAHAVALSQRALVRLVPGVAPVAAGVEVRDRYRAIPVFPG